MRRSYLSSPAHMRLAPCPQWRPRHDQGRRAQAPTTSTRTRADTHLLRATQGRGQTSTFSARRGVRHEESRHPLSPRGSPTRVSFRYEKSSPRQSHTPGEWWVSARPRSELSIPNSFLRPGNCADTMPEVAGTRRTALSMCPQQLHPDPRGRRKRVAGSIAPRPLSRFRPSGHVCHTSRTCQECTDERALRRLHGGNWSQLDPEVRCQ